MNRELNDLGDFYLGSLGDFGRMILAMTDRELVRRKVPHTLLLVSTEHGTLRPPVSINWTAIGIAEPPWPNVEFVVVGAHGELLLIDSSGSSREVSVSRLLSSTAHMEIRGAAVANGSLWLVGGPALVIELPSPATAIDRSPAVPSVSGIEHSPFVFEAIAGLPGRGVMCVGWDGEIWLFDHGKWMREDSPTNMILTCIVPSPSGQVYLLGQAGTVLVGEPGKWATLPQVIEENLWSATWFDGALHACSSQQLFVMDGDELCSVGLPENPETFYSLSVKDDAMLSTGAHDVLLLLPDRMERIV